jgi:hypothetical protein
MRCARVAASSHEALKETLVKLNRLSTVARSTSVIAVIRLVSARALPLVAAAVSATKAACTGRNSPLVTPSAISSLTRRAAIAVFCS